MRIPTSADVDTETDPRFVTEEELKRGHTKGYLDRREKFLRTARLIREYRLDLWMPVKRPN